MDEDLALGEELYHRRKAQEAESARTEVMREEYPLGGAIGVDPPHHQKQN